MTSVSSEPLSKSPWWQSVTGYQWLVLLACYLGNLFDGLDSSLFHPIATIAVGELIHSHDMGQVSAVSGIIVSCFLLGWACGGFLFGMIGDRIGRAKALTLSILIYALFTGLCGLAQTWEQLAACRFMTALGIGGELIVGTTLLAETWANTSRAKAVGFLTTAYQLGFLFAGLSNQLIAKDEWRILFFLGILPALMVFFIRAKVKEPSHWQSIQTTRQSQDVVQSNLSSGLSHLLEAPYLKHVIVASTFTGALLVAYWASTFWLAAWITPMVPKEDVVTIKNQLIMLNGGMAVIGAILAGWLAETIGRRWLIVVAELGYLVATIGLFGLNHTMSDMVYLWDAILGVFVGLSIGGCYIFVPELFPTRLRTTGTGLCFNIGRLVAAVGAMGSGYLIQWFGTYSQAAMMIAFALIPGILIVFWAPETRGQPLRE